MRMAVGGYTDSSYLLKLSGNGIEIDIYEKSEAAINDQFAGGSPAFGYPSASHDSRLTKP